jgi:hypothetical protein
MLLLQKYLDYRIKKGDCSLEWNPLNFDKGRMSSAEQSVDAGTPKDSGEDAMVEDVNVDQIVKKDDDQIDAMKEDVGLDSNKDPIAIELTEEMMFFRELAPGLKIIILKELCDWQLTEAIPIHQFYDKHTRNMNDGFVFGLDSDGNRILHFGGNGKERSN